MVDFLKVFEMAPDKRAAFELKKARHNALESATGKAFNFNSTNRVNDIHDAVRLGLSEDNVKNLLTETARKKLEELSKPL